MPRPNRTSPSVTVAAGGRILGLSAAWFSDGARRRAQARAARRCVECGKDLPTARTPYCSQRCRYKFHGHYFWDAARIYVKRRDRYTCQVCGERRRSRELDVDHILEIARGGAALEYSNLQAICRDCHRAKTRQFFRVRRARRPLPLSSAAISGTARAAAPSARGCTGGSVESTSGPRLGTSVQSDSVR